MTSMVGVEHQLDAPAFVFPVQFWIPAIVANQRAAPHASYRKDAQVVAWTIVGQINGLASAISGAEPLVVAIDERAVIVNDVETIVRLVPACQSVRGAKNDPQAALTRQIEDSLRALVEQSPIESLKGWKVNSCVT
jgi:hypothetical protein